ncbi:MAG TPA: hypothetical protein H9684_03035 [Firmicutes bacterium]|nr:hypothetical protein [Bacillota bacterium]
MNKKAVSIGFVVLLFGVTAVNLLTPQRDFSESENRYLQTLPSLNAEDIASGKYAQDFEKYTADQFVGRDGWIGLKTMAELALLKKDNQRVYFGGEGTLFDAEEAIDGERLAKNAQAAAALARALKENNPDFRASSLLVPTASAILTDRLPAFAPVPDQAAALETAAALLQSDAPLYDATGLLKSHTDLPLYYRTDHHWTTQAAYLVYAGWAAQNGLSPQPESAFTMKTVSDSFYGTLYSRANLPTIRPDSVTAYKPAEPETVSVLYDDGTVKDTLYREEYLEQKDKYSYFLGGNHARVEITTGTGNGRVLLLVQDSYAHCFVPFLTAHYERILVIDPRYFKEDIYTYAVENGATDLLLLYNLPNFSVDRYAANMRPQPAE